MIKAMFFDLDGTLLNSDRQITHRTRQTLLDCKRQGIHLFVATARPPLLEQMLSLSAEELGLFEGGVYYNGGLMQVGDRREYFCLPEEIVAFCIESVAGYESCNIALQIENEKHAFRYPLDEKGYRSWGISKADALPLEARGALSTVKILIFYSNLIDSTQVIPASLQKAIHDRLEGRVNLYVTDSGRVIQIMNRSISKKSCIDRICRLLGMESDEIAVFGDDIPDMEMLSSYRYSFAMGNAHDNVKAAAKHVTLDNDSDGVSHAIENVLRLAQAPPLLVS